MSTISNSTKPIFNRDFIRSLLKNKELLALLYEDWKQDQSIEECPVCYNECLTKDSIICSNGNHLACCSECWKKISTNKCPMCRSTIRIPYSDTDSTQLTAPPPPPPTPPPRYALSYLLLQSLPHPNHPQWLDYYWKCVLNTESIGTPASRTVVPLPYTDLTPIIEHNQHCLSFNHIAVSSHAHFVFVEYDISDNQIKGWYQLIKVTPSRRFHYFLRIDNPHCPALYENRNLLDEDFLSRDVYDGKIIFNNVRYTPNALIKIAPTLQGSPKIERFTQSQLESRLRLYLRPEF